MERVSIPWQATYIVTLSVAESFSVAALETRTNDKVATQFLKKLNQKMGIAPYTMSTLSL